MVVSPVSPGTRYRQGSRLTCLKPGAHPDRHRLASARSLPRESQLHDEGYLAATCNPAEVRRKAGTALSLGSGPSASGPPALLELQVPERNKHHGCRALNPSEKRATITARETETLARRAFPSIRMHGGQPMGSMTTQRTRARGPSGFRLGPRGHIFGGPAVWLWVCYLNSFFLYHSLHL